MSSNATWRQFENYWNEEGGRHEAIEGAVAGAIGGFVAAIIIVFTLWCLLVRNPDERKPAIITIKEKYD
jgi:hypothetical protein